MQDRRYMSHHMHDTYDVFIVVYFFLTGKMETTASFPEGIHVFWVFIHLYNIISFFNRT